MNRQLKKGDTVEWQTSQGPTRGRVVKEITSTKRIKGHTAKASVDHPEYLVQSDKSGKMAVHRSASLKKKRISV